MPDRSDGTRRKIVHIVAHVSPDGRYGGPLRVAADLAREQRANGHDARLVATYEGYDKLPHEFQGVPLRAFPARRITRQGYSGLFSVALIHHVLRARHATDVFHIHIARDSLTTVAALSLNLFKARFILQTHGMVEPGRGVLVSLFDRFALRPSARGARAVLVLTPTEQEHFAHLGTPSHRLSIQSNGIRLGTLLQNDRRTVLFLARLHPRKGASEFASAAGRLAPDWPAVEFRIAGPDEGDGARVHEAVLDAGSPKNLVVTGALSPEDVPSEMANSLLYVLPAVGEPFGLTILEALAQNTPVLIHKTAALASVVEEARTGYVFGDPGLSLDDAIDQALRDPAELAERGARGRQLAQSFTLARVNDEVMAAYAFTPRTDRPDE